MLRRKLSNLSFLSMKNNITKSLYNMASKDYVAKNLESIIEVCQTIT